MKTNVALALAAAGAAALAEAATLTVGRGEAVTVTADAVYETVAVHGDLTVSGACLSLPDGTGGDGQEKTVVSLGADAGDAATLTVKAGGSFRQNAGKGDILEIGANGGWGRVDVLSTQGEAFRMRYLDVAAAARSPDDDPTVLTVGGRVNLRSLRNKGDQAVKVVFTGGILSSTDGDNNIWFQIPSAGGACLLEGQAGAAIQFDNAGHSTRQFCSGNGTVRTVGDCDFVTAGMYMERSGAWNRLVLNAPHVVWGHTGDFRLQEDVRVTCDNLLPVGNGTGDIVFDVVKEAKTYPLALDIRGCTNAVNGVRDGMGNSLVTNSSEAVLSVLRLGTAKDGVFTARAGGRLRIEQTGHTVEMGAAEVACTYVVVAGTLRVTNAATIATLEVGTNSTVVVDGAALTVGTLRDNGGTFRCVNGGRLAVAAGGTGLNFSGVAGGLVNPNFAGRGTVEKTGEGTFVVHQTNAFPWNVHVAAGTWRFAGIGCTNEWWRWTAKEVSGAHLNLASLGLFRPKPDTAGWLPATTGAIQPAPAGTAPADLARNQSHVPDHVLMRDEPDSTGGAHPRGARFLFANAFNDYFEPTSPVPRGASSPETWIPVTFRIAPDAIVGFSQRASWGGAATWPRVFTLETSADGAAWTTALAADNCLWTGNAAWYLGDATGGSTKRNYCPHPLPIGGYDAPCAAGFAAGAEVRVDAGATLDLSNGATAAARAVSSLTVDAAAGGGTVRGLAVPETGTLRLLNVASDADLVDYTVPLALPDATATANFARWTLVVNGSVSERRLAWRAGALCIPARGTVIMVR